jgi:hypothetical protein
LFLLVLQKPRENPTTNTYNKSVDVSACFLRSVRASIAERHCQLRFRMGCKKSNVPGGSTSVPGDGSRSFSSNSNISLFQSVALNFKVTQQMLVKGFERIDRRVLADFSPSASRRPTDWISTRDVREIPPDLGRWIHRTGLPWKVRCVTA